MIPPHLYVASIWEIPLLCGPVGTFTLAIIADHALHCDHTPMQPSAVDGHAFGAPFWNSGRACMKHERHAKHAAAHMPYGREPFQMSDVINGKIYWVTAHFSPNQTCLGGSYSL